MSKKEPSEGPAVKIVYPELGEDKPLYANAIHINHTPWDFALHFSQVIVPTTPPTGRHVEITAKPVAVISIPVTLVRGLIKALETNLDIYENSYGKVEIPREAKGKGGNGSGQ